jgi:hypothetical protein
MTKKWTAQGKSDNQKGQIKMSTSKSYVKMILKDC